MAGFSCLQSTVFININLIVTFLPLPSDFTVYYSLIVSTVYTCSHVHVVYYPIHYIYIIPAVPNADPLRVSFITVLMTESSGPPPLGSGGPTFHRRGATGISALLSFLDSSAMNDMPNLVMPNLVMVSNQGHVHSRILPYNPKI